MKIRLIIFTLIISILTPMPSEAFLNRDCSNLKKRIAQLQSQSDKAWDKYQSAIGKSQQFKVYTRGTEVVNRGLDVVRIALNALADMKKFEKCIISKSELLKGEANVLTSKKILEGGVTPAEFPISDRPIFGIFIKK